MNKSERINCIDVANVLSALAVVFLHVNVCFWNFKDKDSLIWWKSANIIESLFYFAVPVFFMITGSTLLDYDKRYGLKEYIKKRIVKTLIPYIIWSIIGLSFNVFVLKVINISDLSIEYILKGLVENSFVGVYWFFTALFCVYLSIPLLSAVKSEKKIIIYSFISVLSLIINIIIPFIINVFSVDLNFEGYQVTVGSGYLFYVLTGYIICKIDIKRSIRIFIYMMALVGLALQIIGTYKMTVAQGEIIRTYKGYTNLPCVLYSIGIFVFIKYISVKLNDFIILIFRNLSGYTFGVYLIHIYLIRGVERYLRIDNTNLKYRLFAPFAVFFITVGMCWVIKKIPVVKNIIP